MHPIDGTAAEHAPIAGQSAPALAGKTSKSAIGTPPIAGPSAVSALPQPRRSAERSSSSAGEGTFSRSTSSPSGSWAGSGWTVEGFDWRGQGGSGLTHPEGYCHASDFGILLDDLSHFSADGKTSGPRIAIGHSLGGHLLLRALTERKAAFDGAVLLAPMLGIRAGPLQARAFNRLGRLGSTPFLRQRPLWKGPRTTQLGHLTSCPHRHADKLWWKETRPELARGGPTWGWVAAATRSMSGLERRLRSEPLDIPGLILTAANDPIVDDASIYRLSTHLHGFEIAEIPGAGHEILRESDGPRNIAMDRIARFLGRVAG